MGTSELGNQGKSRIRTRSLPHFQKPGAVYSICFRLADSLPHAALEQLSRERDELFRENITIDARATEERQAGIEQLFSAKADRYLDAGFGACYLADTRIASLVADALEHFNGKWYQLRAWCIMPNHVHAVCRLLNNVTAEQVVHSWKSYTANEANRILGRSGAFWMREYHDRIVRTRRELERTIRYVIIP